MPYKLYCVFFLALLLNHCAFEIVDAPVPQNQIDESMNGSIPLQKKVLALIEGKYQVTDGKNQFGDTIVFKTDGKYLSGFCQKNQAFMIFESGMKNNEIILAGYWRFSQKSEIGFIELKINDQTNIKKLLDGETVQNLSIEGQYFLGQNRKISIKMVDTLKKNNFLIIGHRGGGRNSDRYPASENSIEMLRYAERLGANGVEIDVQTTKDGVPILFHDDNMSRRLINEDYFIGKVSDYDFKQIRSFSTLKNGEKIPTLNEALNTVVFETNLKFVWLDLKNGEALTKIAEIQKEYLQKAKQINREVDILIGIPDEEIYNAFLKLDDYKNIPSLCELDESYVLSANSKYWAPNWSLGYLDNRVKEMQSKGINVVVWTLDEPAFIKNFVAKSNLNGILSNYPSLVIYAYYAK